MSAAEKYAIEKLHPNEKWSSEKVSDTAAVFISNSREEDGKRDSKVYESDKMMAKTLAKETGKNVFLLPERNKNQKNPDAFFDNSTVEFKHVRGGVEKVGKNAIMSLKQAENTFLYTDGSFTNERCLSKIKGSLAASRGTAKKNGKKFVEPKKDALLYIYTNGKLFKNKWGDVL